MSYSKKIAGVLKSKKIAFGDRVLVAKEGERYEGILMPKPEVGGDPDSLIIKLSSGYNVGIKWREGATIEKIGAGRQLGPLEVFPSAEIKSEPGLPSVSVIATGGTISSRVNYETGGVSPLSRPEQLFFLAPEVGRIARIRKIERPFSILSEDMTPKHWQEIATTAAKLLNSSDRGLIITHGTDTLHYTAAALSFMLRNLTKPVVLTYAQRSTDRGSTDAPINLICATHAAAKADLAEVVLVGHASTNDDFCLIARGTKVRKMHSSRRDTFRPINIPPLGKVWPDGKLEITNPEHKKKTKGTVEADTKFETKVALVKFYPGADAKIFSSLVTSGYKGIVIEGTGFGHVHGSWLPAITSAIKKGVAVAMAPQTIYGKVDPLVYSRGRELMNAGVIFCEDMLPEVAYVKLGWVLGHTKDLAKVKEMMLTNYAGEIAERLDPKAFLL